MNLENIKYFISLAECLNFTKAAEKEHMTQTSMSRKISGLEDELGIRLFYRDNHQVVLTDAGREFYVQALKLIDLYSMSVESAQNIHHGFLNALKIGVGIYEHELLTSFLGRYVSASPSLRISCHQYGYYELLKRFEQNLLDIIITSDQFLTDMSSRDLDIRLIYDEPWLLGINSSHPLAALEAIPPEELKKEMLITMYDGSISQIIDHYKPVFLFRDVIHVNSFETKLLMINANLGVGLLPAFLSPPRYDSMCMKPLAVPYKPRRFYALCRKNDPNVSVRHFFGAFTAYMEENGR